MIGKINKKVMGFLTKTKKKEKRIDDLKKEQDIIYNFSGAFFTLVNSGNIRLRSSNRYTPSEIIGMCQARLFEIEREIYCLKGEDIEEYECEKSEEVEEEGESCDRDSC